MKNIVLVKDADGVSSSLHYLSGKKVLAVDTETTGLSPISNKITLLQIGDKNRQYVYDVARCGDSISGVFSVLLSQDIVKILHNAKFDYTFILTNWGISMPNIRCSLVGSQLLTKGIINADNSLKGCLDKYMGIKMDKTQQKTFGKMKFGDEFKEAQIDYAAADTEYLIDMESKIFNLLKERGMEALYKLECETSRVTGDMEVNGIFLSKEMWDALAEQSKAGAFAAKDKLDEHFRKVCDLDLFRMPKINYASPQQLLPKLIELTGIPIESTGEEVLKELDHPVIEDLLMFREEMKKITTYGTEFSRTNINPVTGRVHSTFKQLGADTGRMASKEPNLQNIPAGAKYRECFRAQLPGYKLVCADFSGQELRLLAHISREPAFIHALSNNMDLHSYSASLIFGIDYESFFEKDENGNTIVDSAGDPVIKKEMKKKYRNPAKSITFGLIYGMGPGKLARDLGIQLAEAKDLISKYFTAFPKIKETLDRITEKAMKDKYAYSPLDGRRRIFSGVDWDHKGKVAHLQNAAKNQPFQGAGASVTKLALCWMKHSIDLNGWDAKIVLVVHDEILVEVVEEQAEIVKQELEKNMIEAFNHYADSVPMVAKGEIADYWVH